jgi:hypothetical protein
MVTRDELSFYLKIEHKLIWLQPDEENPERERHTVQSESVTITMVWNPNGLHLIKSYRKGSNPTRVTRSFKFLIYSQIRRANQKLIMHADDVRPHTAKITLYFMERTAMKRALHPPYSPDFAP